MASYQYIDAFSEKIAEGAHDLQNDTLKVMLTNVAPTSADSVKADLTDIAAGFGYTAGGHAATVSSSSQTSGTYKLVLAAVTILAAGGSIGPFRYAALYNDTAANDELIGFWDYGSAVTLADGESLSVNFDGTAGVLTIAKAA